MRRTLLVALFLGSAMPAYAAGVSVAIDEVRTISFPKTVSTIYVGNPAIADIKCSTVPIFAESRSSVVPSVVSVTRVASAGTSTGSGRSRRLKTMPVLAGAGRKVM